MLCQRLCRILLCAAAVLCVGATSAYRRCSERTEEGIHRLGSCMTCPADMNVTEVSDETGIIMFVLPEGLKDVTESPLLTLASALLNTWYRVHIVYVYNPDCGDAPSVNELKYAIGEKVVYSLPCEVEASMMELLRLKVIDRQAEHGPACPKKQMSSPYDALPYGKQQYHDLRNILTSNRTTTPHVLVFDPSNVGGYMLAQELEIPAVILAPSSMQDLIFEKTTSSKGVVDFVKRRYDSLALTSKFSRLNRIRRSFGLPLLRAPSEYYDYATILLNEIPALTTARRNLPDNVHLVGPLLPPCIPCDKAGKDIKTVMVMTPHLNLVESRRLLKSITLSRAAIQSYLDNNCQAMGCTQGCMNAVTQETCLHMQKLVDFEVVWQMYNGTSLPELLPSTVWSEYASPMETVAKTPGLVAVICHCDDDESTRLYALGHPLICIPKTTGGQVPKPQLSALSGGGVANLESHSISFRLLSTIARRPDPNRSVDTLVYGALVGEQVIDGFMEPDSGDDEICIPEDTAAARARIRNNPDVTGNMYFRNNNNKANSPISVYFISKSMAWNIIMVLGVLYGIRTYLPQLRRWLLQWETFEKAFEDLEDIDIAVHFMNTWWADEKSIHNRVDRFLQPERPVVTESKREPKKDTPRRRRTTKKR